MARPLVSFAALALCCLLRPDATSAGEPPGTGGEREDLRRHLETWQRRPAPEEAARRFEYALGLPSEPPATPGELAGAPEVAVPSAQWIQIGSGMAAPPQWGNRAGRVRQLAYEFDDAQGFVTLWAGSSGGGLWKRFVFLGTPIWVPVSAKLPGSPSVGAFWVDPLDSNHILIGSGDFQRYAGSGLYRTEDGGATWVRVDLPDPEPGHFFKILASWSDSNTLLAATDQGIFRSITRGLSWTRVSGLLATDLVQDRASSAYWFAGIWSGGVYESGDFGQSFHGPVQLRGVGPCQWIPTGTGPIGRVSVAVGNGADSAYVFALVGNPNGAWQGTYRSSDWGCHWSAIDGPADWPSAGQSGHTGAIAVDPDDANRVFVGMARVNYSENAKSATPCWVRQTTADCPATCGQPCVEQNGPVHADFHHFLFVPNGVEPGNNKVLMANDGGVFSFDWATDTALSTLNRDGLNIAQMVGSSGVLHVAAQDRSLALGALFDNGVVKIDTDAASALTLVRNGDGGQVSISPDATDDWFASVGAPFSRFSSLNGGTDWSGALNCGLGNEWAASMLRDPTPSVGNEVYTYSSNAGGAARVWWRPETASDCSTGWSSAQVSAFAPSFDPRLVDQANNNLAWVFYVTGWGSPLLYVLDSDAPSGTSPLAGDLVAALRTPPILPRVGGFGAAQANADRSVLQPNTVYYVTLDSRPSQALVSENRGVAWRDVTGNLAKPPAGTQVDFYELLANPANLDQMFLATDVGMFRTDSGRKPHPFWYRYMEGMPAVVEIRGLELSWDGVGQKLIRVGSFGRGFWERDITGTPAPLFADDFELGDCRMWDGNPATC